MTAEQQAAYDRAQQLISEQNGGSTQIERDAAAAWTPSASPGVFWLGNDGQRWVKDSQGTRAVGSYTTGANTYWNGQGYAQISNPEVAGGTTALNSLVSGGGGGGGSGASYGALDTAGLGSLDSLLASYDLIRGQAKQKAAMTRDEARTTKETERKREEDKYNGKKTTTLQDFAGAKTDTDLNTRNTLENLISSLSTMGLGGSRALTRQILDAANMSNRKANATQAKDNQNLDTAFNEYTTGNADDIKKIEDQFGFDTGEADRTYGQNRQTALYKKADIYGNAGQSAQRAATMSQGNDLNSLITGSAFMNPSYTGETKAMAAPELGDYTQNIAKYDTTDIGAPGSGVVTPAGVTPVSGATTTPGNLAVRAIAINDKDLGVKKKTEGDLGYGA